MDGEIVELVSRQPVVGAKVTVWPRTAVKLDSGESQLLPFDERSPSVDVFSDSSGRFRVTVPQGFAAVRVRADGFGEHFNILLYVDSKKAQALNIELVGAEPNAEETTILENRREDAQIEARMRVAQEEFIEPSQPEFAASQPVVPTNVRVENLLINGTNYTGLINLDEFISGVISREMGDGFPYEALKAQAVAARTYALARLRDRGYANGGQAYTSTLGARCKAATYNCSGVALTYNSTYISAFFSARCNGDFTLSSEDGLSGLATCAPGGLVGRFVAYLRSVPCSGHLNCSQTTEQCCVVDIRGKTNYIYGHGVGLCQRGAQQFANRDGWNWKQIYNRFYATNVFAIEGNQIGLGDRVELTATANRRSSPCAASATSTALGSRGTLIDGPSVPCLLNSTYYTWWRVALDNGARGWIAEEFLRRIPIAQPDPTLNVGIGLTATPSPTAVQLSASTRANLRVIFESSTTFTDWTVVSTNAANTNGIATFTTSITPDQRHFRARILLPDTLP